MKTQTVAQCRNCWKLLLVAKNVKSIYENEFKYIIEIQEEGEEGLFFNMNCGPELRYLTCKICNQSVGDQRTANPQAVVLKKESVKVKHTMGQMGEETRKVEISLPEEQIGEELESQKRAIFEYMNENERLCLVRDTLTFVLEGRINTGLKEKGITDTLSKLKRELV